MNTIGKHPVMGGMIYAFICLAIATLVTSFILNFSELQEESLSLYIFIIHGLALLIGGWVSGKRAGTKGWMYGGILGIIYCVIVVLISFLAFNAPVTFKTLAMFGLSFVTAAIGGILGVNVNR